MNARVMQFVSLVFFTYLCEIEYSWQFAYVTFIEAIYEIIFLFFSRQLNISHCSRQTSSLITTSIRVAFVVVLYIYGAMKKINDLRLCTDKV